MTDIVDLNKNTQNDLNIERFHREFSENISYYKKSLKFLHCDAPISVLCCSQKLESLLKKNNILRVYDLLDKNFTEIEWLDEFSRRNLTAAFDEFISVL